MEFALLLPLLGLLLLGSITGGLALSRQNSVENAVRETTRFGAVLETFDAAGNLDALYDQVVAAATGDLDPGVADREVCVALISDTGTWTWALHLGSDTAFDSGSGEALAAVDPRCTDGFSDVGSGTERIWVRASRTSDVQAVIYTGTWQIESRSLTRYER